MRNSDRPKKSDNRGGFGENKRNAAPQDAARKTFGDKPAFKKRENGVGGFGERKRIVTNSSESKTYSDRKPYNSDRPYQKREESSDKKPFNSARPYQKREESSERKPFGDRKPFSSDRPYQRREESSARKPFGDRKPFSSDRPYQKREESSERKPFGDRREAAPKSFEDKPRVFSDEKPAHPFRKRDDSGRATSNARKNAYSADKPRFKKNEPHNRDFKPKNKFEPKENQSTSSRVEAPNYDVERLKSRLPEKVQKKVIKEESESAKDGSIRLNRYISNAGVASRRDADELIASGQITVNGKEIIEMGYKVKPTDVVKYGKKILSREKLMYVLLNKPKDFITTTEDPDERRTVMDLVKNACSERIYPVGRLDRNTTGLLLLTNDGEVAEKLSHPSNEIKKIYQVELDKPITTEDFETIVNGIDLEDGFIKPDELALVTPDAEVVGIKIHSGKNRIVRRIFEHLGYEVLKLDRTTYAGLDKKDLPRGKWRFLTEKEVIRLKYML